MKHSEVTALSDLASPSFLPVFHSCSSGSALTAWEQLGYAAPTDQNDHPPSARLRETGLSC